MELEGIWNACTRNVMPNSARIRITVSDSSPSRAALLREGDGCGISSGTAGGGLLAISITSVSNDVSRGISGIQRLAFLLFPAGLFFTQQRQRRPRGRLFRALFRGTLGGCGAIHA